MRYHEVPLRGAENPVRRPGCRWILLVLVLASGCLQERGKPNMKGEGFAGRWRLVREKSDIPPVTKSQTLEIETDGVRVAMRETLVNDKDEALTITVHGKFDGADYPVHGTPFADTVAYTLRDARTIEGVAKKNGVVVVKETAVLADDRMAVRVTYESFDGEGKVHVNHGFFERVERK